MATGGRFTEYDFEIDADMSVAINTGMVNPPKTAASLVDARCSSGNCTFGLSSTVGVCHSCQDVSDRIQDLSGDDETGVFITNFTLSDPTLSGSALDIGGPQIINGANQYRILQTSDGPTQRGGPSSLSFVVLMSTSLQPDGQLIPSAVAFSCSIEPCIKTYRSSMTNSVLEESLISQQLIGFNQLSRPPLTSYPADDAYLLATTTTWRDGEPETCTPSEQEGPGLVEVEARNIDAAPDYQSTFDGDYSEADTHWFPADCVWTFGYPARAVIVSEMAGTLNDLQLTQPVVAPLQFPFRQSSVAAGPMAAKNIWKNGTADLPSIDKYMTGLTDAMTATMRRRGKGGEGEWTIGEELITSTCVRVRWAWFSYPAVLVGLASVFLVALIWQSPDRVGHRAWKSSSLAVLFCAVDDTIYEKSRIDQTRGQISDIARSTKVQLVADGEGRPRFV